MITLTFILVLVSLALNAYLIWQLLSVQRQARSATQELGPALQEPLRQTITDLEGLETASLEFTVDVEEEFLIQTDIAFNETIEVPIQLTVPISDVVETTILIDLLGAGVEVPLDITVPVDVEVPIDYVVEVPFDRTIPISTTIPLDVSVPVTVNVGETELAVYLARLREGLISLDQFLNQALDRVE